MSLLAWTFSEDEPLLKVAILLLWTFEEVGPQAASLLLWTFPEA